MNKELPNNDDLLGPIEAPPLGSEYAQQHHRQQMRAAQARAFVDHYARVDEQNAREKEPKAKPGSNEDILGPVNVPKVHIRTPTISERNQAKATQAEQERTRSRRVLLAGLGIGDEG